jgi:hypothetical protein
MSFSFTASGTPAECIAKVGQDAAVAPQFPQAFADAINGQLSGLPADSSVSLSANGHTGWGEAQTRGEISMHVNINVMAAVHPSAADPSAE